MLHEFEYEPGGKKSWISSSLIVKGENGLHTAMAKTVGLEIGATVMEAGLWYRALTYLLITNNISLTDIEAMSRIAASFELEVVNSDSRGERILINKEDITEQM